MDHIIKHTLRLGVGLVLAVTISACGAADAPSAALPASSAATSVAASTPTASPTIMPTAAPSATMAPTAEPEPSIAASESAEPMPTVPQPPIAADIRFFMFKPDPLEIPLGTTVTWTNQDDIEHSVTSGTPEAPGAAFDSGLFTKGGTFEFTFDTAGEFAYFCTRHNSMQGSIKVTATAAAHHQSLAAPPTRLIVPAIGLDMQPLPVGLDDRRQPVVPRHDVGWYEGSAVPGQGSNVVFWAHVLRWQDTPTRPAPFERVHELPSGAEITVVTGDQRERRYRVQQQLTVSPESVAYLATTPFERLTLISCIGDNVIVDGALTKEFRLVTIAEPVA